MKRIVLLASGSGSNVERIVRYFEGHEQVTVVAVLTNRRQAKVLDRCKSLQVSAFYFNATAFKDPKGLLSVLEGLNPDLIVLAGFLLKIPEFMVLAFPERIINIHPALLPKFGGRGMYGMHVHRAVKNAGACETGISIHYVNEQYDEGAMIFQERTAVFPEDTPEDIAKKVQQLEHRYFPGVIEQLLLK